MYDDIFYKGLRKIYSKRHKVETNFRLYTELMEICLQQFVYTGLPDTIPAEFLEFYLAINGTVAIGKTDNGTNEIYCAIGSYTGDYNGYLPREYCAAVNSIGEIRGDWSKDIVVGINNKLRLPDFDISDTADILTECATSENINVLFSRFLRIPFADDETQKAAIIAAIDSLINGNVKAVTTRNAISEYLTNGIQNSRNDKFLDLVEPDKVKNLQYLNQFHDNMLKRFLMRRGYMFNVTSKMAQQTNDELHGSDHIALIYPLQQFECRQKMIDECNVRFGWNATVELNPLLKNVYDNVINYNNDENNESEVLDDESDGNNIPGANGNDNGGEQLGGDAE